MICLDTHALVWWTVAPSQLGGAARRAIDRADRLGVSAICFWEVALLVRKRRLELGTPFVEWSAAVLSLPRIDALPLTHEIAAAADALAMHDDPADRFIVATARHHGASLVTKDRLLIASALVETIW